MTAELLEQLLDALRQCRRRLIEDHAPALPREVSIATAAILRGEAAVPSELGARSTCPACDGAGDDRGRGVHGEHLACDECDGTGAVAPTPPAPPTIGALIRDHVEHEDGCSYYYSAPEIRRCSCGRWREFQDAVGREIGARFAPLRAAFERADAAMRSARPGRDQEALAVCMSALVQTTVKPAEAAR